MATDVKTRFSETGAANVANQIRGIGASASFSNGLVLRLTGNLNGLVIGAGVVKAIEKFIELGNSFTQVQNKLNVFSSSQAEATEKLSQLALVAVKNRVELDAVSLTYQRLAQNQEKLKLSGADLVGITDTLTKAVALSGSSTAEATSGLRQFTQALGSDFHAAAQEINSILKETPGIALALAKGLGVGVGELKRLGQAGVLNSQIVVEALKRAAPQIDVLFSKTQGNAGQGFTNLATGLEVLVGRLNQVSGAGNALFQFLTGIAQKMIELAGDTDKLNGILETTKTVMTEIAVVTLAVSLGAVEAAFVKVGEGALFVVRAITTGFGGPIFILGTLFSVLFALRSETVKIGNTNVTVGALIKEAFIEVKQKIADAFGAVQKFLGTSVGFKSFREFVNSVIVAFQALGVAISDVFNNLGVILGNTVEAFLAIPSVLKIAVTKGPAEAIKALKDAFSKGNSELIDIGKDVGDTIFKGIVVGKGPDALEKLIGSVVPEGFAKRAAARAAREKIAEPTPTAIPPVAPVGLPDTFSKDEKAITKLVASFDAAIKVQLQFAEAQETIRVAIKDKTISALDGATIAADFARSQFDKLAVSTDAGAKLTAEHAEKLVILSETARRAGISATELGAAQARENIEFDHAIVKIKTVQQSMDALTATTKGIAEGFHEFGDSLGTMFSQISDGVKKTMDDALGAIDTFVQKGTFNFNEFTLQILGDISRIITRLIAIQTINAFKNTVSEGGGIGGFLSRVLGGKQERSPVPGATLPPGASPETQAIVARLTAISLATAEAGPINRQLLTANVHLSSMDTQLQAIQQSAGQAAAGAGAPAGGGSASSSGGGPSGGPSAGGIAGSTLGTAKAINNKDTFGAISGGLGLFAQVLPLLGFAGGGDVEAGRPIQVGERGREVFVPRSNGTIVPHDKAGGAPQKPPVVNVVNVDDPSSVLNAVKTREGEQLIINAVMRNRGRLREVFG